MQGFRHEALLYSGAPDFMARVLPFLRDGIAAGEPSLVVVNAERIRTLRSALGSDADTVEFADMDVVGHNPARIIPAWQRFVDQHAAAGIPMRGVGEPVVASRTAAELQECSIHESLLNVAFADSPPWWLVCPYDVQTLPSDAIAHARRNHPYAWSDGARGESPEHRDDADFTWLDAPSLPEPTSVVATMPFDAGASLDELRDVVGDAAERMGFPVIRREELVLAVHEMTANAIRHGGGRGVLRVWTEPGGLVCEVRDGGRIGDPLVGRRRPERTRAGGRGLWIANQLCDLVQIRQGADGLVVRAHMRDD